MLEEPAPWRDTGVFPISFLADVVEKGRFRENRRGKNVDGLGRLILNFMAALTVVMRSLKKAGHRLSRPCDGALF